MSLSQYIDWCGMQHNFLSGCLQKHLSLLKWCQSSYLIKLKKRSHYISLVNGLVLSDVVYDVYKDKYYEVTWSYHFKKPIFKECTYTIIQISYFCFVTNQKPHKVNTPASVLQSHRWPSFLLVLCLALQSHVVSQPIHFPSSLGGSDCTVLHVQNKNRQQQILLPKPIQIFNNSVLATFPQEKGLKIWILQQSLILNITHHVGVYWHDNLLCC